MIFSTFRDCGLLLTAPGVLLLTILSYLRGGGLVDNIWTIAAGGLRVLLIGCSGKAPPGRLESAALDAAAPECCWSRAMAYEKVSRRAFR
jgi:hypothetical protein